MKFELDDHDGGWITTMVIVVSLIALTAFAMHTYTEREKFNTEIELRKAK